MVSETAAPTPPPPLASPASPAPPVPYLPLHLVSAHVISLSPAGFAPAAARLRAAGFHVVRHEPAVDGRELMRLADPAAASALVAPAARYTLQRGRETDRELPPAGAVGCYLSHLRLWRALAGLAPLQEVGAAGDTAEALHGDNEAALICEDDVKWRSEGAATQVRKLLERLQQQSAVPSRDGGSAPWDVLQLGGWCLNLRPSGVPGVGVVYDKFFGTEAYLVTRAGAAALAREALPIMVQVDAYMGALAHLGAVRILAPTTPLAAQTMHVSTVQAPSDKSVSQALQLRESEGHARALGPTVRVPVVPLLLVLVLFVVAAVCLARAWGQPRHTALLRRRRPPLSPPPRSPLLSPPPSPSPSPSSR